jgi:hypothetical protein
MYVEPPLSNQPAGQTPLGTCVKSPACGNAFFGAYDINNQTPGMLDSNDSRMQQTWFRNNVVTGALDTALNVNSNLRAGVAWFAVDVSNPKSPTVAGQGYIGNTQNNLTYPALSWLPNGNGMMSVTAVGNTLYPSSAFIRVSSTGAHSGVNIAAMGAGPEDDFCLYNFFDCAVNGNPPLARPRWGDYGSVVPVNDTQFLVANEDTEQTCSLSQWKADTTCGNTRASLGNWSTHISLVDG